MYIIQKFRSLLLLIWIPFATLLTSISAILLSLFDKTGNAPHIAGRLWGKSILWAAGVKVKVKGLENVEAQKPCIYAANHQSQFDIFAVLGYLPVQFRWIAKKELFKVPIWGFAMKRSGYIPIDRSNPKDAVRSLDSAAKRIRNGTSILIFPEGTRSPDDRLLPFKMGGIMLALKSGCPIIPVAIIGSGEVLPRGSVWAKSGCIRILIGQKIETSDFRPNQKELLSKKLRQEIEALIEEGKKEARAAKGTRRLL